MLNSEYNIIGGEFYSTDNYKAFEYSHLKALKILSDEIMPWHIPKGKIYKNMLALKKEPNHKIVFEIDFDEDTYKASFSGFCYPDGKILGNMIYAIDNNLPKERFEGKIEKVTKNKLYIKAKWYESESNMPLVVLVVLNIK